MKYKITKKKYVHDPRENNRLSVRYVDFIVHATCVADARVLSKFRYKAYELQSVRRVK